jgi:hypothetical protein
MCDYNNQPHSRSDGYQITATLPLRVLIALCLLGLVTLGVLRPGVSSAAAPAALAARTTSLNESASLHLTSKHGFTLNEQGPASGTVTGTLYVHMKIVSTNHVSAEVSIFPPGGSISGEATASYRRAGSMAHFSGSLTIDRGTGSYNHARGSGLSFRGTIQRSNDAIAVQVSGRVSH